MALPHVFGPQTSTIPLSYLDDNFNTGITLTGGLGGSNVTIGLGNTVTVNSTNLNDVNNVTFTPTDASPAGLTFTILNARSTQIGPRVMVELTLTFPATVDTNGVHIALGSLPACANVAGIGGCFLVYGGVGPEIMGIMTIGTNTFTVNYTANGNQVQNSVLTAQTMRCQFNYSTT
jgi:hypothetical protein